MILAPAPARRCHRVRFDAKFSAERLFRIKKV